MHLLLGGLNHRVHIGVEEKQGECICHLSWNVHYNCVRDGRYCERRVGVHPPPQETWADFTLMMECTPENGHCHSVFRIRIHFFRIQIRIQSLRLETNTDPDPGL